MLGVQLHGLAGRHPAARDELLNLAEETDDVLRNLRDSIHAKRDRTEPRRPAPTVSL